MKKILSAIALVLLVSSPSWALVILDFEGIPDFYWWSYGGNNLNGYYPNVSFGSDATILVDGLTLNTPAHPPRSGTNVLFSVSNPVIRMDFTGGLANYIEAWYNSADPFYMEAYNSSNVLITSTLGAANVFAPKVQISVSSPVYDIAYVLFHDGGNYYTLDDVGYTATPEPATMLLLGSGLLGMGGVSAFRFRRKK